MRKLLVYIILLVFTFNHCHAQQIKERRVYGFYNANIKKKRLFAYDHYNNRARIDSSWYGDLYESWRQRFLNNICDTTSDEDIVNYRYADTLLQSKIKDHGMWSDSTAYIYNSQHQLDTEIYIIFQFDIIDHKIVRVFDSYHDQKKYFYDKNKLIRTHTRTLHDGSDSIYNGGEVVNYVLYDEQGRVVCDSHIYDNDLSSVTLIKYNYYKGYHTRQERLYGRTEYCIIDTFFTNAANLVTKNVHNQLCGKCEGQCNFSTVFTYDKQNKLVKSVTDCLDEHKKFRKTLLYKYTYYPPRK